MQRRLLSEETLSFDNAFKLTLAMETAVKDTHTCSVLQQQHKEAEELRVQKIEPSRVAPSSRPGARATNPVTVVDMVATRQTPVVSDTPSVTIVEKQGTLFVFAERNKHNIHLRHLRQPTSF